MQGSEEEQIHYVGNGMGGVSRELQCSWLFYFFKENMK